MFPLHAVDDDIVSALDVFEYIPIEVASPGIYVFQQLAILIHFDQFPTRYPVLQQNDFPIRSADIDHFGDGLLGILKRAESECINHRIE